MTQTENVQYKHYLISNEDLKVLKKKYEACEDGGTFFFEGNEVLKVYAKYLIEYLEGEFERRRL